jgi:hypothetical protein
MLEWAWTAISIVVMIFCISSDKTFYEEGNAKFPDRLFLGFGAMVFALVFSWPMTGALLREWLQAVVPQAGTGIHGFTIVVILHLVYIVAFIAPPLAVMSLRMFIFNSPKTKNVA